MMFPSLLDVRFLSSTQMPMNFLPTIFVINLNGMALASTDHYL